METDLDRKKNALSDAETKLASVEKEFAGYKIRATSVLKQAKETDSQLGSKSQEVQALERLIQSLNDKISDMR